MKKLLLTLLLCTPLLYAQTVVTNGAGSPAPVVAKLSLSNQTNNVGATLIYTTPSGAAGLYRATCYVVMKTAAATSSTLPLCRVNYVDADTGSGISAITTNVCAAAVTNTAGACNSNYTDGVNTTSSMFYAAPSSAIQLLTTSYASSPANTMAYNVRVKLEYLGPQ